MKTLKRRRLESKTDYRARLALLKSEKPRLVIRKSNRYVTAQIVISDLAQDKVICGVTSKILLSKGWPEEAMGSLKSIPAAYLTGLLLGKCAIGKKFPEAILDMGMNRNIQKSRIYAVLKGAVDSGMQVPHSEDVLPEIKANEKIKKIFDKIFDKIKGEI